MDTKEPSAQQDQADQNEAAAPPPRLPAATTCTPSKNWNVAAIASNVTLIATTAGSAGNRRTRSPGSGSTIESGRVNSRLREAKGTATEARAKHCAEFVLDRYRIGL